MVTICSVCGRESRIGFNHKECNNLTFLDGHIYAFAYEGIIKSLIMDVKFKYQFAVIETFSKILSDYLTFYRFDDSWTISFVPMSGKRFLERGFNQGELLAKQIANLQLKKCCGFLKKINRTHSQVGLGGNDRRLNLLNAFIAKPKMHIPENIILVDDVFTTGTTLNECAKVLKENGAKKVVGLTIARSIK